MATAVAQKPRPIVKEKAAEKVVFQLLKPNAKIRLDTPDYKPYIRLKNTSNIFYEGEVRKIRYLKGYKSIFVDEQEPENRPVAEGIVNSSQNQIEVIEGKIEVNPNDSMKIKYLRMCSYNANSEYRDNQTVPLFAELTPDAKSKEQAKKQDLMLEAVETSKTADDQQIAFHAQYLGIPFVDQATGASRTPEAIKVDYRQKAFDDPAVFLETFNSMELRIRYWISRAIEERVIDLTSKVGWAIFGGSKADICTIPSGTDIRNIQEALYLHANKRTGEDFLKQLRDRYA